MLRVILEFSALFETFLTGEMHQNHAHLAAQLLEYTPVLSLPYLGKWLNFTRMRNVSRSVVDELNSVMRSKDAYQQFLPNLIFYINNAASMIDMPTSFAMSQVRLHDNRHSFYMFADTLFVEFNGFTQ
jgi:hypothetical protein